MQLWKYRRLFEPSQLRLPSPSSVDSLIRVCQTDIRDQIDSEIPAGYTYFGQFINHDLSFMDITDIPPHGHRKIDINDLTQRRKAALDLDSVYGGGIDDSLVPYEGDTGKFILGGPVKKDSLRDLPRRHDQVAMIADPRNDENMVIAQLQVMFMNLHNRIVQHFMDQGFRGGRQLYEMARAEVVCSYIDVVLHDYARRLLPDKVYETIVLKRQGLLSQPDQQAPSIALEFVFAAFRLHSMVRPTYSIQEDHGVMLDHIFRHTGSYVKRTGQEGLLPLPKSEIIDWRKFFDISRSVPNVNAKPISPRIPLFKMDDVKDLLHNTSRQSDFTALERQEKIIDMFMRTVLRGMSLSLPTGQEVYAQLTSRNGNPGVAGTIGLKPLDSDLVGLLGSRNSLRQSTPLWLYIMLEARGNDPKAICDTRLGELGGWIVADALVTAALSVKHSLLSAWTPADSVIMNTLRADNPGMGMPDHLSVNDLLRYTYPTDF